MRKAGIPSSGVQRVKELSNELAEPLQRIFNASFNSIHSIFSRDGKDANITSIFNKKAKNVLQDNVPMAKLPFRIGQDQLELCSLKPTYAYIFWTIVMFAVPVTVYEIMKFNLSR